MKTLLELNPKVGDKVKWTGGTGQEEVYEVLKVKGDRYYLNHDSYHFWCTHSDVVAPQWSFVVDQKPKTFGELSDEEKSELVLARYVRGEDIELWVGGDWLLLHSPEWASEARYRIRPKDPVVETVTMHGVNGRFSSAYICRNDTHKITYNTVDGVIDCSSVKMEEL